MTNDKGKKDDSVLSIEIEAALSLVKKEVGKALSASPSIVREYTSHLTFSEGKYIRAISVLTCALDEQGSVPESSVKLAAAIELLHLATLVHDDVIDNAELRRGELSLQKKYGKRTAVICGDYLLCAALVLAASVRDKEKYLDINVPDYMSRVCLGELKQHINNGNIDLSVYEYLKIIAGKTAALFEASFYTGAVLCGEGLPLKTVKKYARLGRYVGMIFQLTDDCMDFETTQTVAKKPVSSDYEQNVITLPLIHAFNTIKGLRKQANIRKLTRTEINEAVKEASGLAFSRVVAQKYYNKATKLIDELELPKDKSTRLVLILNKAFREF